MSHNNNLNILPNLFLACALLNDADNSTTKTLNYKKMNNLEIATSRSNLMYLVRMRVILITEASHSHVLGTTKSDITFINCNVLA